MLRAMLFRQLFDSKSSTYSYLLADRETREAVFIDTVFEQHLRDAALVAELELSLLWTLETHVHADHVTGAWLMRERFGSQIALSDKSGATGADRLLAHGARIPVGRHVLEVRATPGHTDGCVTYVLDDHSMAFTGDALLIRGAGRTDFQQGDAAQLYRSVHEQILALPERTTLYPGHDYSGRMSTTVGEEKRLNPRLGGERSVGDFVGYMNNLGLSHPKQIDIAVPGNLVCGKPTTERPAPADATWAPVFRNFAGVAQVPPEWLSENLGETQVVDVREPDEFVGVLGHIEGALSIPLGQLSEATDQLDRERPTVLVCRSGGRSARASQMLEKAGFVRVANLTGGMLRWGASGFPIVCPGASDSRASAPGDCD